MEKRKWTKAEKLAILKEGEEEGTQLTIRKHGVYPSTYYSWRKKYRLDGEAGFKEGVRTKKDEHYLRKLEDEIALYKQLLAEKELELALKDDLLKKKYPWARKKI
jgi:transposase-like protein